MRPLMNLSVVCQCNEVFTIATNINHLKIDTDKYQQKSPSYSVYIEDASEPNTFRPTKVPTAGSQREKGDDHLFVDPADITFDPG